VAVRTALRLRQALSALPHLADALRIQDWALSPIEKKLKALNPEESKGRERKDN